MSQPTKPTPLPAHHLKHVSGGGKPINERPVSPWHTTVASSGSTLKQSP